jgi:hypothetical protein
VFTLSLQPQHYQSSSALRRDSESDNDFDANKLLEDALEESYRSVLEETPKKKSSDVKVLARNPIWRTKRPCRCDAFSAGVPRSGSASGLFVDSSDGKASAAARVLVVVLDHARRHPDVRQKRLRLEEAAFFGPRGNR